MSLKITNSKLQRISQGPLLLTCINFNPSMDKWLHKNVGWNYLSIPKLNSATIEV